MLGGESQKIGCVVGLKKEKESRPTSTCVCHAPSPQYTPVHRHYHHFIKHYYCHIRSVH